MTGNKRERERERERETGRQTDRERQRERDRERKYDWKQEREGWEIERERERFATRFYWQVTKYIAPGPWRGAKFTRTPIPASQAAHLCHRSRYLSKVSAKIKQLKDTREDYGGNNGAKIKRTENGDSVRCTHSSNPPPFPLTLSIPIGKCATVLLLLKKKKIFKALERKDDSQTLILIQHHSTAKFISEAKQYSSVHE